jgi:hypothetical protein
MAEESTSPSTPPPATPSASTTWKLPEGIEDHIESGMSRDLPLRNEKNIFLPFCSKQPSGANIYGSFPLVQVWSRVLLVRLLEACLV